jgi:DNA-directed RNA polymerase specialized sigma24 family protein
VFTDLERHGSSAGDGRSRIAFVEPSDEYRELVRVELDDLIESLGNPLWRQAVRMVLEGYTVPEIAAKLDRSRSCVHLWFRTIRAIWEESPGKENLLG